MRFSKFASALVLTLAFVGEAPAQRRAYFWHSETPAPTRAPLLTYTAPYWHQSHWIYSYMPYGYDGFGYSSMPLGVQYGYLPPTYAAPVRDYGPPARSRSSLYPAVPYSEFAALEQERSNNRRGYINVIVPHADAKLWINGRLMTQTGVERSFQTPLLESTAKSYGFDIKVGWTDNFGYRDQQLPAALQIRAGETREVVFPLNTKK
jgi:uncharacterized protein (TIGR03000 family)